MEVSEADGDSSSDCFIFASVSAQDFFKCEVDEIWCPTISGALEEGRSGEAANCFEFFFIWVPNKN